MKFLFVPALLALAACTTGKDTGETGGGGDTDTTGTSVDFGFVRDGSGSVIPDGASMTCDDMGCTVVFTVTASPSLLEVDMTETDDSYLYHEYHDGFSLVQVNADNSETWSLELAAVDLVDDVVQNSTTLFWKDSVIDGTTWYFGAVSADGSVTDCVVTGHNPSYYSEWCTNVQ